MPLTVRFILTAILTTSTYFSLSAQVLVPLKPGAGCLFNGKVYQNFLYYDQGTPVFAGVEGICNPKEYSNPTYPQWDTSTEQFNGSCTLWVDCQSSGNNVWKKGKYNNVNVSFDTYIPFMLLAISAISFKRLYNQKID